MIIGQIKNGIKRIIQFKYDDKKELAEIQNNLLCRLSSASDEAGKNMIKAIKEIDNIIN